MTFESTSNATPVKPRWRFRFTVRTLLIVAALVGLALANVVSYLRARQVEADAELLVRRNQQELEMLRYHAGFPVDGEPNGVQVVSLPLPLPDTWAWRVIVPYGERFELRYQLNDVPSQEFTEGMKFEASESLRDFDAGLHTIIVQARDEANGPGRLAIAVETGGIEAQRFLPAPDGGLSQRDPSAYTTLVTGADRTESFDTLEKVPLIRLRAAEPAKAEENPLAPGFLLWMEQIKPTRR